MKVRYFFWWELKSLTSPFNSYWLTPSNKKAQEASRRLIRNWASPLLIFGPIRDRVYFPLCSLANKTRGTANKTKSQALSTQAPIKRSPAACQTSVTHKIQKQTELQTNLQTKRKRKCRSLWRPSPGKQSPSRLSPLIPLRMSRPRFR